MPRVTNISDANIGVYSLLAATLNPVPTFEFDLTNFRDPIGNVDLKSNCVDGRDARVQEWIKVDPRFLPILNQCLIMIKDAESGVIGGKPRWVSIGFRDPIGVWKSRAVAELITNELASLGFTVAVLHAGG